MSIQNRVHSSTMLGGTWRALPARTGVLPMITLVVGLTLFASPPIATARLTQLAVPILGVTLNEQHRTVGVVTQVVINFQERQDQSGLQIRFHSSPGQFSLFAQQAVRQAISRVSQVAHIRPDSWTVVLTFPYKGLTMYGDSLSAMVGLTVVALAKGDPVIFGQSITGTITEDGHIGKVGGVPEKIHAAHSEHLKRILIPEERDIGDGDWQTPFLMQVSPVGTVSKAYYGLTGSPILGPYLH